jgi:MFS family permease
VVAAFVCHGVNTGLVFYSWSVFLTPLAAAFGGRGPVANGFSVMQLAGAAYSIVVGRIVDQRGARPVQTVGALLLATGFILLARANSLTALYLCLAGPVSLGSTCIGGLSSNAAVARWFVRRRGRALGFATAGISAGGIVFAPLAQYLITTRGWRDAFWVLGVTVAIVVLPPVLAFMRRDPADLGLLPDGEPPTSDGGTAASRLLAEREIARSVRPQVAIRQLNFWLLAASFGLTIAGLAVVLIYQVPLLIDRGFPAGQASIVLGFTAAVGVVGKLSFGTLLDRFDQRRVAAACFCLQTVGVLLLWRARSLPMLVCYVVLYGYAMGGNATLQASLVSETFGRLHYGAIAGRMTPFLVLAQAVALPLTGHLRDATGSYAPALVAVMAGGLVAAATVLRVRLPSQRTLQEKAASHT